MFILTDCKRVTYTRRNVFRPLEGSTTLLCGVWCMSKNRLFMSQNLHKSPIYGRLLFKKNPNLSFLFQFCIKFHILKSQTIYEESVFARIANSTQQRGRAIQWPEIVSAGNPFTGSQYKYIKLFCIIFFFVAPTRNNIFFQEVYPRSDFWAFFDKILSTF